MTVLPAMSPGTNVVSHSFPRQFYSPEASTACAGSAQRRRSSAISSQRRVQPLAPALVPRSLSVGTGECVQRKVLVAHHELRRCEMNTFAFGVDIRRVNFHGLSEGLDAAHGVLAAME